jgi:NAD(P)-dependent dehydrogenase (short-subunit alcohol dehydrogenase family)
LFKAAWLDGSSDIAPAIEAAGFAVVTGPPALLLITNTDQAIANAEKFADAVPPGQEALVVNILQAHAPDDWVGARAAALLWAFTRHAALAWAPRGIRVNAVGLDATPAAPADLAATILAMWDFPSMTGQIIRLGAPRGTP